MIRILRRWVMQRLGIRSEEAAEGEWWEIDFVIAFLLAVFLGGVLAFFAM